MFNFFLQRQSTETWYGKCNLLENESDFPQICLNIILSIPVIDQKSMAKTYLPRAATYLLPKHGAYDCFYTKPKQ